MNKPIITFKIKYTSYPTGTIRPATAEELKFGLK